MKRNTSNWSNFGMLLRRAGLTASAGLSCLFNVFKRFLFILERFYVYGWKWFKMECSFVVVEMCIT